MTTPATRSPKRTWRRRSTSQGRTALYFLAPALIALVVLRLLPAAMALVSSLRHHSLVDGVTTFVGFDNYADLIGDSQFWQSVRVTLLFSLVINPLQVLIALGLAVLLNRRFAGVRFWRSLVFAPIAVPPAVSAVIWGILYRPEGPLNAILGTMGIPPQPFLTSSQQALFALIVLMSWVGVGYWMMFLIAGLQDIPQECYDAAAVDGTSAWQRFVHVTLPLLRRPLAFVLVADTVSNFLVFAPVQLLTRGGPDGSTNLMMYDVFRRAYSVGDINFAQAEVVVLVAITLAVVAVQFRMMQGKGEE
ncbi:carbohydrate ABC transporter permease [Streptomyces sp. Ncost-T10-10d]|uniref:carbohydrate ABC transporter permease n=1 Tax=Streptomyces sp. Ncost-T10-10d TaxID=1839774 RepID=UPI00081D3742|nr:sugar ABC transporter permease [Streptomyces sp. Ncost-T10-10d]SCF56666.1 carbohydrate ABC transporter membrane protein 1, CUT1 family [Streptomyces sp. Ncost-T10-10d]